jgi:hypothetical protein
MTWQEEIADEKVYGSILVKRSYRLLFHGFGAESHAN